MPVIYIFFLCELECFTPSFSPAGSCYMLFTSKETWSTAQRKCKTLGADLVKIESSEENKFIETTFLSPSVSSWVGYWIGLSDRENKDEWKWTDGSSSSGKYSKWKVDSPNNNGDCALIAMGDFSPGGGSLYTFHAEWTDWNCVTPSGYICEKVSP